MFSVRSIFSRRSPLETLERFSPAALEVEPTAATVDYCRAARRLRHQLRHSPARLHRSLRALPPITPVDPISPATPLDRFAAAVACAMESGTLRYSRRLDLLRMAGELGIERFEANLVIATVQHQAMKRLDLVSPLEGAVVQPDAAGRFLLPSHANPRSIARRPATQRSSLSMSPWLIFAAVQSGIALTAFACWRAWIA
jgi:hypothetical protein